MSPVAGRTLAHGFDPLSDEYLAEPSSIVAQAPLPRVERVTAPDARMRYLARTKSRGAHRSPSPIHHSPTRGVMRDLPFRHAGRARRRSPESRRQARMLLSREGGWHSLEFHTETTNVCVAL
jgi:hypothetical protein